MQKSKNLVSAIMATLLTGSLTAYTANAIAETATPMEKCYGVAKMGKNDCGTPTHACAAQAATNNDPNEWIYVPVGTCVKTPGGSLTPSGTSSTGAAADTTGTKTTTAK